MGETAEIIFREMSSEDIEAAFNIESKVFDISSVWSLGYFKFRFNRDKTFAFVAEIDKKIVAYSMIEFKEKIASILKFAVDPNFQGRGIGKKFFSAIIDFIRQRGGEVVQLHALTDNFPAINLYESFGLKITERLKDFYKKTHEDGFLMELKF